MELIVKRSYHWKWVKLTYVTPIEPTELHPALSLQVLRDIELL